MNKRQIVSFTLLASLLLFSYIAVPITTNAQNLTKDNSGGWEYIVKPIAVNFARYGGTGFLYNTVVELRNAYDLNPLYTGGYDGSGQTVVIVDAYGSPTIYQDLLSFIQLQNTATYYGANLPWTTLADVQSHLHIIYPLGKPTFNIVAKELSDPDSRSNKLIGWSEETTLDVCTVHAIAPGANIDLVIAPDAGGNSLNLCVNYAITNHLGCVISQSYGIPEYLLHGNNGQIMQADKIYQLAAQSSYSITVFASSGDGGATNGGPFNNALFPASDPYVTGAGGTNLFMTRNDGYEEGTGKWANRDPGRTLPGVTYNYEIDGNDYEAMVADGYTPPYDAVTAGGAMSSLFALPSWQSGITLTDTNKITTTPTGRCTSDVSYDSGVYGGLGPIPYTAYPPLAGAYIIGGTSACSPFWAALTSIVCQYAGHNLGYINPSLYAYYFSGKAYTSGAFHDITLDDNTYPTGNTIRGYKATTGWDAATGIGSPDANILVPIMAAW
ncbi:MAG: S53 family peptidase [Candidatus Bathyarchaeia archaeon]|jgi:subtilase family serine protease